MDVTWIIGIVAVSVVLITAFVSIVIVARHTPKTPPEDPGRGPTGQGVDPTIGTPSETSTPHYDRRPEGREGPL